MKATSLPYILFILTLSFTVAPLQAMVLTDPGFAGALTVTASSTFTQTDSANFDKWVVRDNRWGSPITGGNPDGYADGAFSNGGVNRTLYQAVTDDKATTGLMDLTFDLNLLDANDADGPLTVSVWGVTTLLGANFSLSTNAQFGSTEGDATLLKTQSFSTNTSGWEGQSVSGINFGTGYDLVILGFYSRTYESADGDTLGIDNVTVIPEPSSIVLFFLGFGLVGFAFRRR